MDRICFNCGEELDEGVTVCPKCGTPVGKPQENVEEKVEQVETQEQQKIEKTKTNKTLGIISIVLSVLAFIICDNFLMKTLNGEKLFIICGIVVSIIGLILGIISIKKAKTLGIVGICLGAGCAIILLVSYFGFAMYSEAKECVPTDNSELYKCELYGQEVDIFANFITEDQMKKEEKEDTSVDKDNETDTVSNEDSDN